MTQLTDHQLAEVAAGAGFAGQSLVLAIAVALAESAGRTNAVNTTGNHPPSRDRGLWQINSYWHPEVSDAQAFDPQACAAAAYRISGHGASWVQWSTYNSGSYKAFLARAHRAADTLTGHKVLHRILRYRHGHPMMTGADVAAVQRLVGLTGSGPHGVDGIYGPWTSDHVKAWQRRHGLADDGDFGPRSCAAAGWSWAG
jgi:peptidoglycan hydrolase-like protein with peptidoglycan-binding domain